MTRPDTQRALASLKDFQRDTVDYVFHRMYEQAEPTTRFLVADEVGLGKTKVAQGVIARVIDRLWDTVERIDVVYICSNAAIARQNINRLNLAGLPEQPLPDRITLLPREVRNLSKNRVNLISFTPGTSFNLRSSQGTAEERALLYWLLPAEWKLNKHGAVSVLTGGAGRDKFGGRVEEFPKYYSIDASLQAEYQRRLEFEDSEAVGQSSLRERFTQLADALGKRHTLTDHEWRVRSGIVSELRSRLAAACIESLQPDLIILDEFQRFRDLLHGGDAASDLARQLFTYPDARVLMLSATPYKMFTMADESGGDEHYADFVQTVSFLQHNAQATAAFRGALATYRKELFRLGLDNGEALLAARSGVEHHLRNVMVRTERLAMTSDRSGMLAEMASNAVTLEAADVDGFLGLQKVARTLGQPDTFEYWKSAPYLLSFMDEYKLKQEFLSQAVKGTTALPLAQTLARHPGLLIESNDVDAYRRIDPANGRMRALAADTLDRGLWRMLWLPPSLPYYRLEGEFEAAGGTGVTKRLVFSAWHVVPKVVASLLSYEAERRMLSVAPEGQPGLNNLETRHRRGRLLRFGVAENRPTGMPAMALLYPCSTLALDYDPLTDGGGGTAALSDLHAKCALRLRVQLGEVPAFADAPEIGEADQRWYWAAPLLLDQALHADATRAWFGQADLAGQWRGEEPELLESGDPEAGDAGVARGWSAHVDEARKLLAGSVTLGPVPADLAGVLAYMALAAPAVTALRSLARVCGGRSRITEPRVRNQAGRVAEGLRSLFNQVEVSALVRQGDEQEAYWRRVLEYGARGCLQSVLDEYAHALVEWTGAAGKAWPSIAEEVATSMRAALSLRTATVAADRISTNEAGTQVEIGDKVRFRTNFAVRFGASGEEKAAGVNRDTDLLKAFNSPFWPFVLCSTSVGQEGLDFHLYCHAVVHWNLPSNPVDLEQREGRVHRYKGHAVRRNIATIHAARATDGTGVSADPWTTMFEAARAARAIHESDLVPYWVYPIEGGARIERHIPALPLSKDRERADALRRSLAVYRMAFGQSRQEDLVKFLLTYLTPTQIAIVSAELKINLAPDPVVNRPETGRPLEPLDSEPDHIAGLPGGSATSLEQFRTLLDTFAAMRPSTVETGVAQFTALLDDLRRASQQSTGATARE